MRSERLRAAFYRRLREPEDLTSDGEDSAIEAFEAALEETSGKPCYYLDTVVPIEERHATSSTSP